MAIIEELWIATLTKTDEDAGTETEHLTVTVNVGGIDVVDQEISFLATDGWLRSGFGPDDVGWLEEGQAAISGDVQAGQVFGLRLETPIDSAELTNSSIRVGSRSDDAWAPQQVLVLGSINTADEFKRSMVAVAMETDLERWVSTDADEGKLTFPIRLVGEGSNTTPLFRVAMLAYTPEGSGTDSDVELQISTASGVVLIGRVGDTPQNDLDEWLSSWYTFDAATPFSREELLAGGSVRLRILGTDEWRPLTLFLFGLDTADGRPNNVVLLHASPKWPFGSLSADGSEGDTSVLLSVMS